MGYYDTIILPQNELKMFSSIDDLFKILDEKEYSFLQEWYPDLCIEDRYLGLSDYYRKNYHQRFWVSIISKIAKQEKQILDLFFYNDYGEKEGYRAFKDGSVKLLEAVLQETTTIYPLKLRS